MWHSQLTFFFHVSDSWYHKNSVNCNSTVAKGIHQIIAIFETKYLNNGNFSFQKGRGYSQKQYLWIRFTSQIQYLWKIITSQMQYLLIRCTLKVHNLWIRCTSQEQYLCTTLQEQEIWIRSGQINSSLSVSLALAQTCQPSQTWFNWQLGARLLLHLDCLCLFVLGHSLPLVSN